MKLKCAIIDDEELAVDLLESFIEQIDSLELVGKCRNAIEGFNLLQKTKVDLIFLDIQMPKISGIEFVKSLSNPPKVIFTTAYSEYAVEGFDLNAIDYLLKPISFDRFMRAINKVQASIDTETASKKVVVQPETDTFKTAFIYLKEDKVMVKVMLKDILYIESLKNYVKVKTKTKDIVTYKSISSLEEKLPSDKFLRVHRSYIVATDRIEAFSATHIDIGNTRINIGRNYKNEVLKSLNFDNILDE